MINRNIYFTVFCVFLMSIAFQVYAERMEPVDAAKYCFDKNKPNILLTEKSTKGIVYKPDGHIYTTASVAIASGLRPSRAFALAYFSQYPDLDKDYDAVSVGIQYSYKPWQWGWRNTVLAKLHSLHGEDHDGIKRRRSVLLKIISSLIGDPALDWQTGLLIHSYGDSYAHTHTIYNYGTDKEEAYGPKLGHAWDSKYGVDPDKVKDPKIPQYFDKFTDYITTLFDNLRQPGASEEHLTALLAYYNEMECDELCPTYFEIMPTQESETNKEPLKNYMSCMLANTRKITRKDIYTVTNRF